MTEQDKGINMLHDDIQGLHTALDDILKECSRTLDGAWMIRSGMGWILAPDKLAKALDRAKVTRKEGGIPLRYTDHT